MALRNLTTERSSCHETTRHTVPVVRKAASLARADVQQVTKKGIVRAMPFVNLTTVRKYIIRMRLIVKIALQTL